MTVLPNMTILHHMTLLHILQRVRCERAWKQESHVKSPAAEASGLTERNTTKGVGPQRFGPSAHA